MSGERPQIDDLLEALQHELRCQLIQELLRTPDRTISLPHFIERQSEMLSHSYDPETLELHYYHNHLPKLDGLGLVTYDWDTGEITYTGEYPPERVLEMIEEYVITD